MNLKIKFEKDENDIYRCIIYKNKEPISNADLLEQKQEWIKIAKKDPLKGLILTHKS